MNNLHNIVVYINDEAMLQEARGILIANYQKINERIFKIDGEWDYLQLNFNEWGLNWNADFRQEITLPELEQLLKKNRDER